MGDIDMEKEIYINIMGMVMGKEMDLYIDKG
jgi:hypothetical protein